ncbi:MAG: NADP-dependent phosphogluconate dehydrogenase [Oligoflexia bacterium]|nr:NADP-dependent phosphogluconate dehydrogenase [Oligoflexia bacterium]
MQKPHVGMIGLAVMGSNLIQNIESRGYACAVFNRNSQVTDAFMAQTKGRNFVAGKTLEEFVGKMQQPRQIIILVKAGAPVDQVLDQLIPLLDRGDMVIDGGNSHYLDTRRREARLKEQGLNFIGLGVSGGEEGALKGPSLMPGGPREAWKIIAPLLNKIAAQVEGPCTTYIGPEGSGHFVKMVHNGIEYGDMQLIAEAYHLLRQLAGCSAPELADVFGRWNEGSLASFLIEITAEIFKRRDDQGEGYLVDKILDKAAQKGTGKWTIEAAQDLAVAVPTLTAAVDARLLSSIKEKRLQASKHFINPPDFKLSMSREVFVQQVHDALYASKIMAYAQGMALLAAASREWKWELQLGEIAAIWRGGCIIRARFLGEITRAYRENPALDNLILDQFMQTAIAGSLPALRTVVGLAAQAGVPVPAFAASLSYFDSYRTANLPQNLTQAQRDFFGAHTFERTDKPGSFHAKWEQ